MLVTSSIAYLPSLCQNAAMEKRRLFFGVEIEASWPEPLPKGRLLLPECRHLTLAFLGNIAYEPLQAALSQLPLPTFQVGPVGIADKLLFLPPHHAHVVASHVNWFAGDSTLADYQRTLTHFLRTLHYQIDDRAFLAHITLAREPFEEKQWRKWFEKTPVVARSLHLYESVGNLVYKPLWSHLIQPGFEEIEHTADAAFIVRGTTLQNLFWHAHAALAHRFPPLLNYVQAVPKFRSLDEIISALNGQIAAADQEEGCPYKAVSWHGEIVEKEGVLEWEMIVDV